MIFYFQGAQGSFGPEGQLGPKVSVKKTFRYCILRFNAMNFIKTLCSPEMNDF